jgi:hypothetical protein
LMATLRLCFLTGARLSSFRSTLQVLFLTRDIECWQGGLSTGTYVLQQELSPIDLMTFVDDSRRLCNRAERTISSVQRLSRQVESMRELARFFATPTSIGLEGGCVKPPLLDYVLGTKVPNCA